MVTTAKPYLPDILLNPLGTVWDFWQAYPLGLFSMAGIAPTGSKEAKVKALSRTLPIAFETKTKTGGTTLQSPHQYVSQRIETAKTTSTTVREAWEQDTIPEPIPGWDLLGDLGKYIPLIIIAMIAIIVLPKIFGGKK